ncbi:Fe2OG dioxygenase domain-containing protein [Durusdinium trenchii]|uniref:Fe2OG dioxygenase domain-containing protein n=1 Tax=Durusdinium trenchii TaxID=1381693 RepID=A0ABP0R234_9DINO
MCEEEWKYQMPEVSVSGGFLAQRALPQPLPAWPAPEPLPQLEVEEQVDVTSMLVPPKVQVDPDDTPERTTPVLQPPNTRRKPAVPLPPKRLVIRSRNENDGVDADQADVDGADVTGAHHWAAIHREAFAPPAPASQLERQKRMEHLLRRRKHGRERIMPEDFYRENLQRQQATSLPPRRRDAREQGEEEAPRSARGLRSGSPSLPPIDQAEVREERCCNFAKHPLLCCQGTSQAQKAPRHVVRLERRPGMERLGFGNVVAGPRDAPVSVNGVSQDVPRMREELRSQASYFPVGGPQNMELVIGWNGVYQPPSQEAGQTPGPSFPQMAGLISAAEMMMKAGNLRGGHPVGASPARMAVHWLLKRLRQALQNGQPFVVSDFLFEPVAEALLGQMQQLSDRQDDQDESGYPFQRLTEGPLADPPDDWDPLEAMPCKRVVDDFQAKRAQRFAFTGHILVGRKGDKHNAWYSAFQKAMQHPAVLHFWQQLSGIPSWVTGYDPSWSWLREGDFYGLHADDAQVRYLAVTIHLVSSWSPEQGGELLWCGPEGDDFTLQVPDRPHFHRSFNVSRNGTSLVPGYNVAVLFPVYRNSYHAVAPVKPGPGRRFTLQGWYVDPCQFSKAKSSCMPKATKDFKAWSEEMAERSAQHLARMSRKKMHSEL